MLILTPLLYESRRFIWKDYYISHEIRLYTAVNGQHKEPDKIQVIENPKTGLSQKSIN